MFRQCAGRKVMWMRKVGDGTETTVEQALMRGLVTAWPWFRPGAASF